jgi:putative addiction module component (TIGR02574 family)
MSASSLESVLNKALGLPAFERVRLIESLVTSLEPFDPELERSWLEELDRRVAALQAGTMKTYPVNEVFTQSVDC